MKTTFILALIILPIFLCAQNIKPPKIHIEQGFFSTRYELGDKTTPAPQIALHLKQNEPDAYIQWKGADRADNNAIVWMIIGCAGILTGVVSQEPNTKLLGYSVGAGGLIICLVPTINSGRRRQKAIDIYNTKFGY